MAKTKKQYDFRAWLKTMPSEKSYDFDNCDGKCAMGQYMEYLGEAWDLDKYRKHINEELGGNARHLAYSDTFGELRLALEAEEVV